MNELERVSSDEFQSGFGLISTDAAVYRALRRSSAVADVRAALTSGKLQENQIRHFVATLLRDWSPDLLFPHDTTLAALAVVMEDRWSDFADEYLHDLARLDCAEFSLAPRVARLCLATRSSAALNRSHRFVVAPNCAPDLPWRSQPPLPEESDVPVGRRFQFSEALCRS
jgi:hypothetical protein